MTSKSSERQPQPFKELTVYKGGISDLKLCTAGTETAIYFVKTAPWSLTKPDIVLHASPDASGPIKGVVRMRNLGGHYTVGLGDPRGGMGLGDVRWENFQRVRTWNPQHKFTCEVKGVRKWFLWRKPGRLLERVGDMELVESEPGEEGDKTDGSDDGKEILVKYERPKTAFGKKRGKFEIKNGLGEDWELMVLLTGMALVLIHRRNSGK